MNSYACLELNAHTLSNEVFSCMKNNCLEKINFNVMYSQPCENTFRSLRSLTSTLPTVVNCAGLEAINWIRLIQLISEMSAYSFRDIHEEIKFPRVDVINALFEKKVSKISDLVDLVKIFNLRNISETLMKAKSDAVEKATSIGMEVTLNGANKIQVCEDK